MNRPALSPIRGAVRPLGTRRLRLELTLLFIVLLVALGFYLDNHPIELGADDPELHPGEVASSRSGGDVVLVLGGDPAAQVPESFDQIDFSAGWTNLLDQEMGGYRIVTLLEFSPNSLENAALVIVPRMVGQRMTPGQVAAVAHYVETGGRLLVEMPSAAWASLAGVSGDPAGYRPTRRITAFDGSVVSGDLRDDLLQAPLHSVLATVSLDAVQALGDVDVVLEVDGQPGLLRRIQGRGEVYALLFDLAQAVTTIQQGVPSADWEVARPSVPLPPGLTRSAGLVGEQRMRHTAIPSADLLERQILQVITARRPMPRVWLFPGRRLGAFVMTHSALPSVADGRFMWEWEAETGSPSTIFVAGEERELLPETANGTAGVLLWPPQAEQAPEREIGLLGFAPFIQPESLADQLDEAVRALPPGQGLVTRLGDGLWLPDYRLTFRMLAGLGVWVDSSLGPAFQPTDMEAVDGYCFGTGLPFRPLDTNGGLLPVWEIPYVLHDGQPLEGEWLERMLQQAASTYHELLVADWRSGTMRVLPRAEVVTAWRRAYEAAQSQGMWVTDLASYARFWESRLQVTLRSEFSTTARRLSIWVEAPHLAGATTDGLVPGIAFEARYEDQGIERITLNGADVPFAALARTGDGLLQILEVPEGSSRIEVLYQGPIDLAPPEDFEEEDEDD